MENRNNFIKKLIYRSKYTGTRIQIMLLEYAEKYLKNLNDDELLSYEKLLISGDPRIWRLSIDIEQSVDEKENIIVELIKNFKGF